ncbi:peptidoglycan DD-metalloendopeptidase family protein [Bordetella genomosp. 4]|uniref:Peptidase n=1 Tax=Bordetella genomosp. 4 TaxID=463044 RepID=A0A261U468_9BORD|nr:peptidoglycan DD-metalloendopeptidase family protein [Bordetella genomosp. 4]OZI49760.1 peptidase [Bordetella genomosp. 4]OZI56202.1 peptidase [Bordetella genomosp. 4]
MLNGQLPLTALYFPQVSFARLKRPAMWAAGALGLSLIYGCSTSTSRAPVVDLSNQPSGSSMASAGGSYVVKPGDTLYQIARSNGVSVDSLKQWNNISDANQLSVGQVLKLSAGGSAGSTVASAPPPVSSGTTATPVPLGEQGSSTGAGTGATTAPGTTSSTTTPPASSATPPATSTTPAASETPPASVATPKRAADASLISWGWPASGAVTQTFTTASKGIDIGGSLGAPVVAAADGKVMYSGNGVRGLGNLIIINHENGFITAYAHNQTLLVKTGQAVKRGSKIAEIGQSDTTSPRLHFEIRRQGTPVDPLQYLPAR